jgi:hypothetical protein
MRTITVLDDPWECQVKPTLDNRHGDFALPASEDPIPVQTWAYYHRREKPGEDGLAAGWPRLSSGREGWESVHATFGPQGWRYGPRSIEDLPGPQPKGAVTGGISSSSGWEPVVYSLSRGILRDSLHWDYFWCGGHIPEEFLDFGMVAPGLGFQYRTAFWMPAQTALSLAIGGTGCKRAWLNGQPVGEGKDGYLWMTPVMVQAGLNRLDFQVIAEGEFLRRAPWLKAVPLRAYWALLQQDSQRFRRPEWIMPAMQVADAVTVRYRYRCEFPFTPAEATVQVAGDFACRLQVNGRPVGFQNGSVCRPYPISSFTKGLNTIEVESCQRGAGGVPGIAVDAVIHGAHGEQSSFFSDAQWQVKIDGSEWMPACLSRRQWHDNSEIHFAQRPHPLAQAGWLDGNPAPEVVLPVVPDAWEGATRPEWLRWTLPPGVRELTLPVHGKARLWANGEEVALHEGKAILPYSDAVCRQAVVRVEPERGYSGGALLHGPVTYEMSKGTLTLGSWVARGLEAYSGGLRYIRHFRLDSLPGTKAWLDLGRVRGTAEVWLNGKLIGSRLWSPYRLEISGGLRAGDNVLEVRIDNTLAPYLHAVGPTRFAPENQRQFGLFGPVRILAP